jgi:DNA-binding protein YbaB
VSQFSLIYETFLIFLFNLFFMDKFQELLQGFESSMQAVQAKINEKLNYATSGGGVVKAAVNGKGDIVSLDINIEPDELKTAEDVKTLSDLVIAAIKKAQDNAAMSIVENMSDIFQKQDPQELQKMLKLAEDSLTDVNDRKKADEDNNA